MRSIIGILVLFIMAAALADGPPSHRHPTGEEWIMRGGKRNTAGEWCCGEGDCFKIPGEQISETPDGYLLFGRERVPHAEVQPSQDGLFWRCKRPDGTRRCFFAPPPST